MSSLPIRNIDAGALHDVSTLHKMGLSQACENILAEREREMGGGRDGIISPPVSFSDFFVFTERYKCAQDTVECV